jgi:hypothetical protein
VLLLFLAMNGLFAIAAIRDPRPTRVVSSSRRRRVVVRRAVRPPPVFARCVRVCGCGVRLVQQLRSWLR